MFSFLLIFYAAVLHLSVFIFPDPWQPAEYGILMDVVYQWTGKKGFLPDSIAIVLLFIQGFGLNNLNFLHRLSPEVNLFPGVFFILVSSLFPEFLHLSPLHLANIFYLLALNDLMAVYNNQKSAGFIFNSGLWIGIGSLFYFSYIVFIVLAFLSLTILRAFSIRERIIVLLGIFVPYLLGGLYFFWVDRFDYFLSRQVFQPFGFLDFSFPESDTLYPYLALGVFAFLLFLVIFSYNSYLFKRLIQIQKKIKILFWGLFLSAFTLLFQPAIQLDHLLIMSLPLGLLLSINFVKLSRNWAELFHILLLLTAFLFQYHPYLLG